MRPEEPKIVKDWYKKGGEPPMCCFTCDYYSSAGYCIKFDEIPPAEYAQQVNECPHWLDVVPF